MNVKTKDEISNRFKALLNLKDGWKNSKGKSFHPIEKAAIYNAIRATDGLIFIDEINCEFYNSVELHYSLKDNFVNFSVHSDYILITAYKDFLNKQDVYYPRYNKKIKFNATLSPDEYQYAIDFLNACIIYYLVLKDVDLFNISPTYKITEQCMNIMHNHKCLAIIKRKEEIL